MIIGEIRRYLRDNSSLRISRGLRDIACRVMHVRENIMNETHREPSDDEVAEILGIKREDVVFAMEAMSDPVSINEALYTDANGESVTVMDQLRDDRDTDASWLEKIALDDAVKKLSDRERRILAMRFLRGKTQMEVASEVGISQAQVSRLEKNAVERIKKELDILQ